MPGTSLRIGRLAGIPIGISPWWLIIVGLITWALGGTYYPDEVPGITPAAAYALGLGSALLLFASILVHELGHAVVARRRGIAVEGIDLWLLGGVAKLRGTPHTPGDELRYAAAGPAVTAAIALGFGLLALVLPTGAPDAARAIVDYQLYVNTAILGFNLLPAFPLDGGRLLRAIVWGRVGEIGRATAIAARVGRGFAYAFVAFGVLAAMQGALDGLWLSIIGVFLAVAGSAEEAAQVFATHRHPAFPVVESGRVVGLLTLERVEELLRAHRAATPVRDVADTDADLVIDEHLDLAELLERPAFQRLGRAVVVPDRGPVGIVSMTEVQRALRTMRLPRSAGHPPTASTG